MASVLALLLSRIGSGDPAAKSLTVIDAKSVGAPLSLVKRELAEAEPIDWFGQHSVAR